MGLSVAISEKIPVSVRVGGSPFSVDEASLSPAASFTGRTGEGVPAAVVLFSPVQVTLQSEPSLLAVFASSDPP